MVQSGVLHEGDASLRSLQGLGAHKGCGLVEMLVFKRGLLDHLLTRFLPDMNWDGTVKKTIMDTTRGHMDFRDVNGYPGEAMDLTWRAGWPKSAEIFYSSFLEACTKLPQPVKPCACHRICQHREMMPSKHLLGRSLGLRVWVIAWSSSLGLTRGGRFVELMVNRRLFSWRSLT